MLPETRESARSIVEHGQCSLALSTQQPAKLKCISISVRLISGIWSFAARLKPTSENVRTTHEDYEAFGHTIV